MADDCQQLCINNNKCSFSAFSNLSCGFSTHFTSEKDYVQVSKCQKDISGHLRSLKLAQDNIPSEGHLLLYRIGFFVNITNNFLVCPNHRAKLGIKWKRQSVKCSFPDHTGQGKSERSITPQMSSFILSHKGVLLPVGSGICRKCRFTLYDEMKSSGTIENMLPERSTATDVGCEIDTFQTEVTDVHVNKVKKIKVSNGDPVEVFSDEESLGNSQSCSQSSSCQPDSQSSSWSEENNNTLENFNTAVTLLGHGRFSPLKFRVHQNLENLKPSTKRLLKRKATETVHLVLESMAPGQGNKLLQLIQDPVQPNSTCNNLEQLIINLYSESTDKNVKKQLLSMIASSHSKKELQQLIPSITMHAINEARKHALEHSAGAEVPKQKPAFHSKMDLIKLDHALDFIFNPAFHQVSSVGIKEMKLDDGSIITIPEVVRTVLHSTLVKVYMAYCEETDFIPLSRSTLFHILSVCPASKRTNLKGLDNAAADGGNSYDILLSTISDVEKYVTDGMVLMELRECKESLIASRIYMKTDFKLHVKQEDHCSDHCINYALSDPHDKHFQQSCTDHQHDIVCDRCQLLPKAISNLKEILSNLADLSPNTRDDMLVDIETAEGKIIEWKSHILRTINQDKARTQTLHDLQTGDILLIMDWAMKFLPLAFREKQSDWYGQKGINWHVSVCIYKDEELNLKHRTFAHLMDGVKQDWMTIACLLEDTLHHIKMQIPNTERVFIRSDNAGCYHCGNLWLAIPGISMRTGVFIARYDYSEAQSGKSYCDAKIAHMRGKLCKVAASGHNILSAADMKSALDLYGGTTGCQASHVELKDMPPPAARYPIKGISRISNVEFEQGLMRTWQAYGIGRGKQMPIDHENNDLAVLEIISNFVCKSGSVGHIRKPQGIDASSDHCFMCPEGGCTQVFNNYSDMQNHCFLGNHTFQLQAISTYDDIKLRWMDACSSLSENVNKYRSMQEEIASEGSVQTEMGWGLKRERKHVRFTEDMKMYLNEIFQRGENNGSKVHPSVVVQNMRVAKKENGEKRFSPKEYMSVCQILSYFSRLSAMRKTSSKDINDDDLDAVLLNIAKMETTSEFQ